MPRTLEGMKLGLKIVGVASALVAWSVIVHYALNRPDLARNDGTEPESTPSPSQSDADVSALTSLYEADRADASATLTVALALLGAGVAYVTGTLAFADSLFRQFGWLSIFVPFPMWLIAAFHSLITVSAMLRSRSILVVEDKLLGYTSLSKGQKKLTGMRGPGRIMNVMEAEWPHKLATILSYLGVGLIVLGYTVYFLLKTPHLSIVGQVVAGCGSLALLLVVICSWWAGLRSYNKSVIEMATPQPEPLGNVRATTG